jgi:hypothetical protein
LIRVQVQPREYGLGHVAAGKHDGFAVATSRAFSLLEKYRQSVSSPPSHESAMNRDHAGPGTCLTPGRVCLAEPGRGAAPRARAHGGTRIAISHRLGNLRASHRIAVLIDGPIGELGRAGAAQAPRFVAARSSCSSRSVLTIRG